MCEHGKLPFGISDTVPDHPHQLALGSMKYVLLFPLFSCSRCELVTEEEYRALNELFGRVGGVVVRFEHQLDDSVSSYVMI